LYESSVRNSIHDGNGRIGRAIAEKALSQGFGYPAFISLSQAIASKATATRDL
jgi:Fic family protein